MRQTPQPYSSPLVASSYKSSIDSSYSTTTEQQQRRRPTHPPPLHIRTGSHLTNNSQTNLPGTPSSLRFPSHRSGNDPELTSPALATGRSSLESAFRKRSRSNTATTDPAQQAASVAQLRQKFQEKEAAKDRKYAEAKAKALRKKERKEERSRAASEQSSLVGVAYASREAFPRYGEPVSLNPPQHPPHQRKFDQPPRLQSKDGMNEKGKKEKVGNGWLAFWIGVRGWLLRISKKMGGKKKVKGGKGQ